MAGASVLPSVLIVGGGIIGCATAHELAKRGCSVTLLERGVPAATVQGLKDRGHKVVEADSPWGGAQMIQIDWDRGVLIAGSEPRKDGLALGY